jgi:hypothetical protein
MPSRAICLICRHANSVLRARLVHIFYRWMEDGRWWRPRSVIFPSERHPWAVCRLTSCWDAASLEYSWRIYSSSRFAQPAPPYICAQLLKRQQFRNIVEPYARISLNRVYISISSFPYRRKWAYDRATSPEWRVCSNFWVVGKEQEVFLDNSS